MKTTPTYDVNILNKFLIVQSPSVTVAVAEARVAIRVVKTPGRLLAALGVSEKVLELGDEDLVIAGIVDRNASEDLDETLFSAWVCYPVDCRSSDDAEVVLVENGIDRDHRVSLSAFSDVPHCSPGPKIRDFEYLYRTDYLRFPGSLPMLMVESDTELWELIEEAGTLNTVRLIAQKIEAQYAEHATLLEEAAKTPDTSWDMPEVTELEPLPDEVITAVNDQLITDDKVDAVVASFLDEMGVSTYALDDAGCVSIDKVELLRCVIASVRKEKEAKLGLARAIAYTEHAGLVQDTDYIMDKVTEDVLLGNLRSSVDVPSLSYEETISALQKLTGNDNAAE